MVQNVAPRNLDALHRRLRETILVRTHKDDVAGCRAGGSRGSTVPLEDAADRDWFDEKARDGAAGVAGAAQGPARPRRREGAGAGGAAAQIRSAIYQHATRAKRQAVLDYLLALPPEHKASSSASTAICCSTSSRTPLRARGRRLVEHNGDNSARAAATVRAFQTRPEIQFFIGQLRVSNLSASR